MGKKCFNNKTYFHPDYTIFFALKIMDYPDKAKRSFTFNELKQCHCKDTTLLHVLAFIAKNRGDFKIKIDRFEFDPIDLGVNWKKTFKSLLLMPQTHPAFGISENISRIVQGKFDFFDLESLLESGRDVNIILAGVNFRLIMEKDAQNKISKYLKKYIDLFIEDKLKGQDQNYSKHETQKKEMLEKITQIASESANSLIIKSSDLKNNNIRFWESLLALEKEGFLDIISIGTEENELGANYRAEIEFKGEVIEKPFCITDKGYGFLKFSENGERIRIGKVDSQPFKLLKTLLDPLGTAKSIEFVFEKISNNDHAENDAYLNMNKMIRTIRYSITELQKGNKMRGKLTFKIDKIGKKIWLKFNP